MNAAYLYAQLEMADEINEARLALWDRYYQNLLPLAEAGKIELPVVPEGCVHNAHMFYIKARDIEERTARIADLKKHEFLPWLPLLREKNSGGSTVRTSIPPGRASG